jgi:hypothetical protein
MPLSAELTALTVPAGTEFPGTVQELLELIAQYESITGLNPFSGINYGDTEPDPSERDRPWFQINGGGNPVGWFSWNGSAWTAVPMVVPSGTTAQRPSAPVEGQKFFDTDIEVELIYHNSLWITSAGSPGDIKEVKAASLAAATLKNPGWSQDTDSIGKVIAGASDGTGTYAYDGTAGADEVTLSLANLPNDTIELTGLGLNNGQWQNGPQDPGKYPAVSNPPGADLTTGPINPGTQEAVDVRQPTIYYWRLVKD